MSSPGVSSSAPSRRQKRMGPAPFASFEDLSDELDSPEDKHATGSVVRLPGIREDATPSTPSHQEVTQEFVYTGISLVGAPVTPPSTTISSLSTPQESQTSTRMSLQTPSTPRIDISRASSSSHHEDSRDSTPERELFEGNEPGSAKLGLAFKEEGTLDLRSSTEELDFQDPQEKAKLKARPQSPFVPEDSLHSHQRKDSQSSEIGLLSISGRTSRLSSIGSQGSAQSRISNASRLSVISGQSGRSPSPHKMLLETSFCGSKLPTSAQQNVIDSQGTKVESDVLEKMLLSRKHDPREAILAEGISVENKPKEVEIKTSRLPVDKIFRTSDKNVQSVKSDITIKVDKSSLSASNNLPKAKLPKTFVAPSGVEYTYIPLKGPLPEDDPKEIIAKAKTREVKSASVHSKPSSQQTSKDISSKSKSKSTSSSPATQKPKINISAPSSVHKSGEEPKYIRIKLKPDYMYDDEDPSSNQNQAATKPDCLDLTYANKKPPQSFAHLVEKESCIETVSSNLRSSETQEKNITTTPTASPKPARHSVVKETNVSSKSPSPSLSRKSSFTSIFRSRETIVSPESPTVPGVKRKHTLTGILKDASESLRDRSRSRSKSRDRDKDKSSVMSTAPSSTESIDSKSKQKSVLSIFKPNKKTGKPKSEKEVHEPEVLSNVEFTFNIAAKKYYETPLQGESIRIPLHSPTYYEDRAFLQDIKSSSQDSQETVIDTTKRTESVNEEAMFKESESNTAVQTKPDSANNRQSSTSSENIVFSTKLGSNNEIFTTKLPKEKHSTNVVSESHNDVHNNDNNRNIGIEEKKLTTRQSTHESLDKMSVEKEHAAPIEAKPKPATGINNERDVEINIPKTFHEGSQELNNKKGRMVSKRSRTSSLPDEDRHSSESEHDVEEDYPKVKRDAEEKLEAMEPERKGLVLQQDSFDDELPYVPTTLPLERSVAVPIVPIKQRGTLEMRTYPIERPRSTTPINPSCLEDYCEDVMGSINTENITKTIEKLKISLPREESGERFSKVKSPRKPGNTTWFEFAGKGISSQRYSPPTQETETTPPPLPPKGAPKEWINFEEIPERRKPPRRIQTIPSRGAIDVPDSVLQENVVYNYVNPEDCKCECHESARERERQSKLQEEAIRVQEDEVPLLEDDPVDEEKSVQEPVDRLKIDVPADRRSIVSDSSIDLSTSFEHAEANGVDPSLRMPFTSDLGVSSNRSSIVSQDEPPSPDSAVTSPNAFPKVS